MVTRYDTFFGVRLPRDLVATIRDLARQDDRTAGAYVRRVLVAHVAERTKAGGRGEGQSRVDEVLPEDTEEEGYGHGV